MTKIAVLDDWQGVAQSSADWSPLSAHAEVVFFAQAFDDEDDAAAKLADFEIVLSMRERTPLPGFTHQPPAHAANAGHNRRAQCLARHYRLHRAKHSRMQHGWRSRNRSRHGGTGTGSFLAAARAIPAADANMRAGRFQEGLPVGISLAGKTIGIIGLGRLGSSMASYCRALNMTVLAWSENLTAGRAQAAGTTLVSKEALLSRCDAVSIHLVLSPRSRGLIGASDIAMMKPGAILINTSRGPIVDEAALIEAVRSHRIIAALDVYDREPLPGSHPFRSAPNTVLTPHLGYGVQETWKEFYRQSIENALAFLDGKPVRVTNPEALRTL